MFVYLYVYIAVSVLSARVCLIKSVVMLSCLQVSIELSN